MLNKEMYMGLLNQKAGIQHQVNETDIILVTDPFILSDFETQSGQVIGVVDNQPFYNFCMDVYYNKRTKQYFRYCNVSYSKQGAAVLVVLKKDDTVFFLLNHQYRAFLNTCVYEIPRGFSDPGDSDAVYTAIRELAEETNINISTQDVKLEKLGIVHPDSGLTNNVVSLFMVAIRLDQCLHLKVNDADETIIGHQVVTEEEFLEMVAKDQITDSFTLAAYAKYKCRKE